jgi:hypothetical protein
MNWHCEIKLGGPTGSGVIKFTCSLSFEDAIWFELGVLGFKFALHWGEKNKGV